jgi:small subunit ribosomal protein S7
MKNFTASSRQLKPDPVYNSKLAAKFINCLMLKGKKSVAERLFYDAMAIIEEQIANGKLQMAQDDAGAVRELSLQVFETAVNNVKPLLEVRSRRVGGASYQVPMQVGAKRQQSLAFRWIIQSVRSKKGKPMCRRLASELTDAYDGHGGAMTTRENVHRMAEANKAFAHFAW